MKTTQRFDGIISLINTFAKTNKVSKEKVETLVESILNTQPKQGRPVTSKTVLRFEQIKSLINQGVTDSLSIRSKTGMDVVDYNNTIHAMKAKGILQVSGKVQTGKRGRQPQVFMLGSQ